jgi:hypothetical protein
MILREKMVPLKWSHVMEDVGSFIIDLDEQTGFNKEKLLALLAAGKDELPK